MAMATKTLQVLTLTADGEYYNAKKRLTYRYVVTGDKHSLTAYQLHDERVVVDDNNRTLFFTNQELGPTATLRPNQDGSAWYAKASLVVTLMNQRIDQMLAASGLSAMLGGMTAQAPVQEEEDEEEDNTPEVPASKATVAAPEVIE